MQILGLLLLAIALAAYLLPTIVAALENKRKTGPIFLLNIFLGWTVVGWIGALVWAVADERAPPPSLPPAPAEFPPAAPAPAAPAPVEHPSPPGPGERVHLTTSRIVHVDPAITARSTGELRAGSDVTIQRTSDGWVWVQSDRGEQGWIQL
jgi:hypothetical protein